LKKYECSICGFIFDEAIGDSIKGIQPETKWIDVLDDWACPLCGASKSEFNEKQINTQANNIKSIINNEKKTISEFSNGQYSALFSNLSKGFEKQYKNEEADLFNQLSDYYNAKNNLTGDKNLKDLQNLISKDLKDDLIQANLIAKNINDRGALRSVVWGEKVTKILDSCISRYNKQKNSLLENTKIYVCEICGFIFIGEEPPEVCPVCKVPKIKIKEIKRR